MKSVIVLQGEQYKLIWPDQQEFVRMAARFGATIVPFGTVGEDDIAEVSSAFSTFCICTVVENEANLYLFFLFCLCSWFLITMT